MDALHQGYAVVPGVLSAGELSECRHTLDCIDFHKRVGGIRNAEKKFPIIGRLAQSSGVLSVARQYLEGTPKLVRAIVFDKSPERNWLVTWHQDKTVSVNRQFDGLDWGPWSLKDSVIHVQPPLTVLEHMITIRVHIDDANESNGCLKVIPESHNRGVFTQAEIHAQVSTSQAISCPVKASDAFVMRPLLLHSSSKVNGPHRRRVVHLEFSDFDLPEGVHWD
jgi:hypothetical protein